MLANLPPQEFLFMGKQTQELFLNGLCQTAAATPACVVRGPHRPVSRRPAQLFRHAGEPSALLSLA